jgi:hypothetical protein
MLAVLDPLRNSLMMDPDDVSNTRIKVPCQETKHRNTFHFIFLATNKNTATGTYIQTYAHDEIY